MPSARKKYIKFNLLTPKHNFHALKFMLYFQH